MRRRGCECGRSSDAAFERMVARHALQTSPTSSSAFREYGASSSIHGARLAARQHLAKRRRDGFDPVPESHHSTIRIIATETVELYIQDGKPLPEPTSGRDYAIKMLLIV